MPFLIVSIHDVSPFTWAVVQTILEDLEAVGVRVVSLLVIPDHHRRGHFHEYPDFCQWLRVQQEKGHEIVTHGTFHLRERTAKESWLDQMITRVYTANEGEFYDLTAEDAEMKMRKAQADFAVIGLQPVGFIAPAWLLSEGAERAARETGFHYTTTLREVRCLQKNTTHVSQSLVYSVRSAWRRQCSLRWNRWLAARLASNPVIRLGIHPPDWSYPAIRRQILTLASNLAKKRTACSYANWTQALPPNSPQ